MKPPIRWAGSKLKSLALLRSIYNAAPGRYVEAFAGSACLFFDLWNGNLPNFDPAAENWHTLCTAAYSKMQFQNVGTLSHQMWANVLAITRHTNETGHSPKTMAQRKRRDLEMRTRFEHAADVLRDVIQGTKNFRY